VNKLKDETSDTEDKCNYQFAKMRLILNKLEALPKILEEKTKDIINQKSIMTLLDAENEYVSLAGEIFGAGEIDEIDRFVTNYLQEQNKNIKQRFHETIRSRPSYLDDLLSLLSNPEIQNSKILLSDSYGNSSKEVPNRFGLEIELSDYIKKNPSIVNTVFEKASDWIKSDNSYVQGSGYDFMGQVILYHTPSLTDQLELISKYEDSFADGISNLSEPANRRCLAMLCAFMGVQKQNNIFPKHFYRVVDIARNSTGHFGKVCKELIAIASLKIDSQIAEEFKKYMC